MTHRPLILGARASQMARIVAHHVQDLLARTCPCVPVETRFFKSQGDLNQGDLSQLGGKGAFVKDLERRLMAGEIDCAVHALKDVPGDADPPPGLHLHCYLDREDPRDALVMRPGLPVPDAGSNAGAGITLATSSPRRQAFLRGLYPQARVIPLRGNVDTRLQKLQAGDFDGMVLSLAGLERLGLAHHVSKVYAPEEMLPAVGQGVLCLQVRTADLVRCDFLHALHSATSGATVTAERTLLRRLQGHCHAAIAGYCVTDGDTRWLRGWVADVTGTHSVRAEARQPLSADPATLGETVADALLQQGAAALIAAGCLSSSTWKNAAIPEQHRKGQSS